MKSILTILCLCLGLFACANTNTPAPVSGDLKALPSLDAARYMGTWYQVAYYPNRFQAQCVSDTAAKYTALSDGTIEVNNRCKTAKGTFEEVTGLARPVGQLKDGTLSPAKLQVRFAPAWLSWLPFVWGDYWVIDLVGEAQNGYRYAIVSEPKREYLWVLSRTPRLSAADEASMRATLQTLGFDLGKLQAHLHAL
jgi:apolipoprotein D and lipocalin family protein